MNPVTTARNKVTVLSRLDIFRLPGIYNYLKVLFYISNSKAETEGLSGSLVGSESVVGSWQFQSPLEVFNVGLFFFFFESGWKQMCYLISMCTFNLIKAISGF